MIHLRKSQVQLPSSLAMTTSTPRRSRRYQPILSAATSIATDAAIRWSSDPVKSRTTIREDLNLDHDEDWNSGNTTTTFYKSMTRISTTRSQRTYGKSQKGKAKAKEEEDEIQLGDTVLVETSGKRPSVGVVVAMWGIKLETRASTFGEDETEDVEEEEEKLRVRIHWFTQPSELPTVRAKRDHLPVSHYQHSPQNWFIPVYRTRFTTPSTRQLLYHHLPSFPSAPWATSRVLSKHCLANPVMSTSRKTKTNLFRTCNLSAASH